MMISTIACSLAVAAAGNIVARVDGTPISRQSVAMQLNAARQRGRAVTPQSILDALVGETVLANEARRLGLDRSPDIAGWVEAETRRAAADVLIQRIAASAVFSEDSLRNIFRTTNDHVSYEYVVFESQAGAVGARKRLDQGSTLASEAKRGVVSEIYPSPEKAPPLMRGQIEAALADALFAAAPGQIVGPVELKTGWIVARMIRKELGTDEAFAASRESLVAYARKQAGGAARKHLIDQMKAKASIKVDEQFLATIQGTEATGPQLDRVVATVNGRQIRYRDIVPSVRAIAGGSGHMAGAAVKVQVAWKEVENQLLQDAALEKGLGSDPAVVSQKSDFERAALARAAAAAIESTARPPTEDEIAALYRSRSEQYGRRFEEVLPLVAADAAAQKRREALLARFDGLKKRASIEIDRKALEVPIP